MFCQDFTVPKAKGTIRSDVMDHRIHHGPYGPYMDHDCRSIFIIIITMIVLIIIIMIIARIHGHSDILHLIDEGDVDDTVVGDDDYNFDAQINKRHVKGSNSTCQHFHLNSLNKNPPRCCGAVKPLLHLRGNCFTLREDVTKIAGSQHIPEKDWKMIELIGALWYDLFFLSEGSLDQNWDTSVVVKRFNR